MANAILIDGDHRSISIEDGVLTTWWNNDVSHSMYLTPAEAVNLASVLLQYATQNGASRE